MAKLSDFIAFRAAVELIKENFKDNVMDKLCEKAIAQNKLPAEKTQNVVKELYQNFTAEEISKKIAQLLTPNGTHADVEIIFQSIEGLHNACPNHKGDWYFTGDYPTPGGNRVVNRSFINFMEGKNVRAY